MAATFFHAFTYVFLPLYFIAAFIVPTWLVYKRTKINPITFGQRRDSAHDYVGSCFKLIILIFFSTAIGSTIVALPAIHFLQRVALQYVGVALTLISFLLIVLAQRQMGTSWRIGIDSENKTDLVTTGLYRRVRNPIFLGMLLTIVGFFLIFPTYIMLGILIVGYLLINIQIRLEEEFLQRLHGETYANYRQSSNRLFPKMF